MDILKWFRRSNTKQLLALGSLGGFLGTGGWDKTRHLESYEKSLYVYACVSKIARKVATAKLRLYQIINSKGDVKEVLNHPALDLLYKFNPYQTKSEALETYAINRLLAGDAFWLKVRNERGKVIELWNLRPDRVTIVGDPEVFIKEYLFTRDDGQKERFDVKDIIHFKNATPLDPYWGTSPLKPAVMRIDTEYYATLHQRNQFINSAVPGGVLEVDSTLSQEQVDQLTEQWEQRHKGAGKQHRPAILQGGIKYQRVSLTPQEMDFIESLKFTRDDILVAFGVPKPIVAVTDDVNRANAETAMFIFLSETIKPELERLVEKLNEDLIYPEFGEQYYLDFVDPTPANRELQLKEYESGIVNNYRLINEVRAQENLPPISGGWSFYKPVSVLPVGGLSEADRNAKQISRTFEGKGWLKVKMEVVEEIKERVASGLAKAKQKTEGEKAPKEPRKIALLPTAEVKQKYYVLINKKIDTAVAELKKAMIKLSNEQQQRVLAKLNDTAKAIMETKAVVDLLNKPKEAANTAKIILPFLVNFASSAGEDALDMLAPQEEFELPKVILNALKKRATEVGDEITQTTLEKLSATISEGLAEGEGIAELTNRVIEVYDEFDTYRAERIARTESTAANAEGTLAGFKASGVANAKEWVATNDSRTRDSHAEVNGEVVALDDTFSNGLRYPGDSRGDPEETINCRCVAAPAFIE